MSALTHTPTLPRTCLAFLCLLVCACSGEDDTDARGDAPEASATAGGAAVGTEITELNPLFEPAERRAPLSLSDDLRALDAEADGWPSEVMHDLGKKGLHHFLEDALLHPGEGADPADWVAEDYAGSTEWRPDALETAFDDGSTVVLRADPEALADAALVTGVARLPEQMEELRAAHGGNPLGEAIKIVRVWPGEGGRFRVRVLVQVNSQGEAGVIQQNLVMEVGFSQMVDGDGERHAHLRSARVLEFEEVRSASPWFAEHTAEVFGQHPWFEEEFQKGVNAWHNRTDRLFGNFFMGWQGVAVGDADGDGLDDVYVAQHGGLPNRLFLQQPDGSTREVAAESNVAFLDLTRCVMFLDLDDDGDQDLVLSIAQHALICWNDGSGRFPEYTGLESPDSGLVHTIAAADPDDDGDLDLYLCRYDVGITLEANPVPYHDANNGAQNIYWQNEGGRSFVDATAEVGLDENNRKFSLAAMWEDHDDDGDLDLFVTNDFGRNNLYVNDGGRFHDAGAELGIAEMAASMGVSASDYDLDGDLDFYVSNMFSSAGQRIVTQSERFMGGQHREAHAAYMRHARGNTLFRNDGASGFADVTEASGTSLGRWAWGAMFVDFNNDGYDDLYVPNGFITNREKDDL